MKQIYLIIKELIHFVKEITGEHPWDWVARFILGMVVFFINIELIKLVIMVFPVIYDNSWLTELFLKKISPFTAVLSALNFIFAIEAVQFDIFGLNKRLRDTFLDLVFGGIGICIGLILI